MRLVYILDDHKLFSNGLELLLHSAEKETVGRSFDNSEEMFGALTQPDQKPEVFLLDYYMPGEDLSQVIGKLKDLCPAARIIVVSASISPTDRKGALAAGAEMFLSKSSEPEMLLSAINSPFTGEILPDHSENDSIAKKFNLTTRQLEILLLATKGLSNKEIARILDVSPETIKSHMKEVFLRLGVSNRIEAIDFARSIGLA